MPVAPSAIHAGLHNPLHRVGVGDGDALGHQEYLVRIDPAEGSQQLVDLGQVSLVGHDKLELSLGVRIDQPLQIQDGELVKAALGAPLGDGNRGTSQIDGSQYAPGDTIRGYIERDTTQVQATAVAFIYDILGSEKLTVVTEAALFHVHDMPSKSKLRMKIPNNPPVGHDYKYADDTAWGYRVLARMTYNNVIGPINMAPRIAWRHDVNGNAAGPPPGAFIEGARAITLGTTFDYQSEWSFDIAYTDFFGGSHRNLRADRDLISANIKYSF